MEINMDKVQFESRREVDEVACALQEWLDKNKQDSKAKTVERMIDLLDAMYMSW